MTEKKGNGSRAPSPTSADLETLNALILELSQLSEEIKRNSAAITDLVRGHNATGALVDSERVRLRRFEGLWAMLINAVDNSDEHLAATVRAAIDVEAKYLVNVKG